MSIWAIPMLISGGLFAGGAMTFAWSRVPAWRKMPLPQFMIDFTQTIHRAGRIQPALLVVAIATASGFGISGGGVARVLALVGAAGFLGILLASVAILVPLQRRIIASSQAEPETVEAMQRRWFSGHLGRSVLAVISFALTATAVVV